MKMIKMSQEKDIIRLEIKIENNRVAIMNIFKQLPHIYSRLLKLEGVKNGK